MLDSFADCTRSCAVNSAKEKCEMAKKTDIAGKKNDKNTCVGEAIEACGCSPHTFLTRAAAACGLGGDFNVKAAANALVCSSRDRSSVRYTLPKEIRKFAREALSQPDIRAYFET